MTFLLQELRSVRESEIDLCAQGSQRGRGKRAGGGQRGCAFPLVQSAQRSKALRFEKSGQKRLSGQNSGELDGKSSLSGARGELPAQLSASLLSELLQRGMEEVDWMSCLFYPLIAWDTPAPLCCRLRWPVASGQVSLH